MLIQFIDFGAEFCWIQQWMQVIFFEFPSFWMGRIYECLCYGNVSSGAFYAGNFRGWSGQLSISSSQQPPATHPATLRKTHQDLPSMAEELAMTSLVCCKASTARCFGIFSGPGGAGGWDGWHVKHRRLQGFKTLRWFKHLKSLHTGDMIYIYI